MRNEIIDLAIKQLEVAKTEATLLDSILWIKTAVQLLKVIYTSELN